MTAVADLLCGNDVGVGAPRQCATTHQGTTRLRHEQTPYFSDWVPGLPQGQFLAPCATPCSSSTGGVNRDQQGISVASFVPTPLLTPPVDPRCHLRRIAAPPPPSALRRIAALRHLLTPTSPTARRTTRTRATDSAYSPVPPKASTQLPPRGLRAQGPRHASTFKQTNSQCLHSHPGPP